MAKSKEQIEQTRQQEVNDIREVMGTEAGRRVVYKLLDRAGIYRCSFAGQSNQTIFNEGGRNQGLMLLSDVTQHAPNSYQQMLKENDNG
jgi:exoribonuclease R